MSVRSNDESIGLCENGRRCRHELVLQCRTFSDLRHRNLLSKKESLSKKIYFYRKSVILFREFIY